MSELSQDEVRATIWKDAERISDETRENDGCVVLALLLASAVEGASIRKCAKLLGIPRARITWMAQNLRENGVWRGQKVDASPWFEKDGGSALTLDGAVGLGYLQRNKGR